jgi:hypothetical protein
MTGASCKIKKILYIVSDCNAIAPFFLPKQMTTLTFPDESSLRPVREAIEQQHISLQHAFERTQRKLQEFEQRYNVATAYFLEAMTAEDLRGGDLEYVEWAGEAQMLTSLQHDIAALEYARSNLR